MENLTHTLTGVLLSRAGLNRLTPRATAICVVAANLPDVDFITLGSAIDYLTYHRHITHALPAVPFMAALAVLLVKGARRLSRRPGPPLPWGRAWVVSLIATLSHTALDMMNAYGTRVWLPFSDRWEAWDVLFVIDFWVWGMLVFAVAFPRLKAWSARSSVRSAGAMKWAAVTGLACLTAYIGVRAVMHERAVSLLAQDHDSADLVLRVAACPAPFLVFEWMGLVETEDYFLRSTVDLRERYEPSLAVRYDKLEADPALRRAERSTIAREYLRFAQYGYAEMENGPNGYRVRFTDFRFRRGDEVLFECTVVMDRSLEVLRQEFVYAGAGIFGLGRTMMTGDGP
jgi:inner membrane protein